MKRLLIQKLIEWKNKQGRKPLILKGTRQVGKTHLLKEFGKQCFERVHYFNFEKDSKLADAFLETLDPSHILQSLSFHQQQSINVKDDLIIFDGHR